MRLEGHLRQVGDGNECSNLAVDGEYLMFLLEEALRPEHVSERIAFLSAEHFDVHPNQPPTGTPISEERYEAAMHRDGDWIETQQVQRDYGRVRITIEQID